MPDPLIVDRYPGDGHFDPAALRDAGLPWVGLCLKLSQGIVPAYSFPYWVRHNLSTYLDTDRAGDTAFGRMYHYVDFSVDGKAQGDFVLQKIEEAGGEGRGILPLMIDVERGGQRQSFLTKDRVVEVTSAIAERYYQATGRRCTLYTGELSRALGITTHMGCDRIAVAAYSSMLPAHSYEVLGWDYPDEWQYDGDGEAYLANYPREAPGCGKTDIAVLTQRSGLRGLRDLCSGSILKPYPSVSP